MRGGRIALKIPEIEAASDSEPGELSQLYKELTKVITKQYHDTEKRGFHSYHKEVEEVRQKIRAYKAEHFEAYRPKKGETTK